MGEALRELHFEPQLILCSPAKRTRETHLLVAPSLAGKTTKVEFDEQLYLTSPETLFSRLKAIPFEAQYVLLIGHNPGLHGLALALTGTGDAKSVSRLEDKLPTAALAIFTFPQVAWRDLIPAAGHLEAFITPRDRAATD
jgi:phosphohistidine phosphatase